MGRRTVREAQISPIIKWDTLSAVSMIITMEPMETVRTKRARTWFEIDLVPWNRMAAEMHLMQSGEEGGRDRMLNDYDFNRFILPINSCVISPVECVDIVPGLCTKKK